MSFEDLPPQVTLVTEAGNRYAEVVTRMSKPVLSDSNKELLDLPYGDNYWQKIDIFLPKGRRAASLPAIIFAHGGSWIAGCKEWMAFMAPLINGLPAIFVSISYRLAPEAKFPTPLEDCADAFHLAYKEIERLGGDLNRIFVGGHSAGGHLATLLALKSELLMQRGLPQDAIKGCLAVSAPFDLRDNESGNPVLARAREDLLDNDADAIAASPMTLVRNGNPPFLITVGKNDFPFLAEQAPLMAQAFGAAGVKCEFQALAEHDHFETNTRMVEPGHPWLAAVRRMIAQR